MKMNFKFALLACTALATTFTSCSKDGDEGINPVDGEKGKISLSFTPVGLGTKAMDLTHTTAESAVTDVTLFVYDATGRLERTDKFDVSDFTQAAGVYSLSAGNEVEVVAEPSKKVYVGVNMPASLVGAIQANSAAGMSMTTAYNEALANMTTANKFTMFSDNASTVTVTAGTTATVPTMTVSRLAAKLSVKYDNTTLTGSSINVAGGKIDLSTLSWAIENQNDKFRILRPNGTTAFSPDFNWVPNISSYEAILGDDPAAGPAHDLNAKYVMENIPDVNVSNLSDVVTYIRIRCTFEPTNVMDATGATVSYTAGTDFYTLSLTDGNIAYFANAGDAATWAAANSALAGSSVAVKYDNGQCDYGIFINKTAGKFDVVRNHYYAVTVSAINGIGVPADPNTPIIPTTKEKLTFSLQVNDWVDNSSNEQI